MRGKRLHVDGLEEASAGQVRQTSRVVAISLLGRKRLERLVGLPTLDADHRQTELPQPVKQDRRHASGLEYDPTTARRFRQLVRDRVCHRRRLAFIDNSALAVENANMSSRPSKYRGQRNSPYRSPLPNRRRSYWPPRQDHRRGPRLLLPKRRRRADRRGDREDLPRRARAGQARRHHRRRGAPRGRQRSGAQAMATGRRTREL